MALKPPVLGNGQKQVSSEEAVVWRSKFGKEAAVFSLGEEFAARHLDGCALQIFANEESGIKGEASTETEI